MSLSVPKVSPFGEEFGYVEQQLRLQTKAPVLKVKEMFDISLKPINVQFDNFCRAHVPSNVVDVFIPTNQIKQSKADVISHGFKVHPKEGFTFTTNDLEIDTNEKEFEVFHLKVALASIINYQDPKAPIGKVKYQTGTPTVANLESGYNTLRIGENKFVVFIPNQIKGCHLLRFTFEQGVSDADPDGHVCQQCGSPNATVYCLNCHKKLCDDCDHKLHESSDFMKQHKVLPLEEAIITVQKCPEHPDHNVEYYCPKCHLPICLECKVNGSHAHGDPAKHKLLPISQAYEDAMTILKKPSPYDAERERGINNGLDDCERRLQEITANQQAVEDEIMRIAMKAIEESRMQSSRVANQVNSTKCELLRKKQEYEDQKALVENYRVNAEPVPFLETVFRDSCLKRETEHNVDLPQPLSQKGNLIVYGRIEVSPPKAQKEAPKERALPQDSQSYSYVTEGTTSTVLEPKDPHWTRLSKMAARKRAKYENAGITLPFRPFDGSRIITDQMVAERLYLCLPFKGTPEPHILYSTELHSKNIHMMHKMIDEMGITAVIVKSGDQVFGGFAATKWTSDGVPRKDKSSTFLFQVTKDAFIPYGGRSEEPLYTVATPDTLSFGGADLVLAGQQFERCSSALENSFGLGFLYGSQKAKEFLAGQNKFAADIVEVWGFFTSE